MQRVIVVGGGVAALETCLALHNLAGDRVSTTLVAPNRYFIHRPVGVRDPLAIGGRVRVPLASVARAAGADLRHDRVETVDPRGRRLYTAAGYEVAYDTLVLAIGAVPLAVPAGAATFSPESSVGCRVLVDDVRRGKLATLAFVEPSGPCRPLDLYDLALETAVNVRRAGVDAELTLVTAAPRPLAILGLGATGALYETLRAHGLRVVDSAYVRSIHDGLLELAPLTRHIAAAGVIALPRLGGPRPVHVPCDADGFVPVDRHGRVPGAARVFAAGDCTAFGVKDPSLAAEQGLVVASAIAAEAGAPVRPIAFEPVLRCILPSRLRWYVESPIRGGLGDATRVSAHPLWSQRVRFGSRFLTPYLESELDGFDPTVSTASAPTHATTTAIVTA